MSNPWDDYAGTTAAPSPASSEGPWSDYAAPATSQAGPWDDYAQPKATPEEISADPIAHALVDPRDKARREEAYQAYQTKARQPITAGSAATATGNFLKGAVPLPRGPNGEWQWPLGTAAVNFAGGIAKTVRNIGTAASGLPTELRGGDDLAAERAARQLGVGVEAGQLEAGHQLVNAGRNLSGLASAVTGGRVGTQESQLSDADMRRRFNEELAYRYLTQEMGKGRYKEEVTGELKDSPVPTPEELAAKGYPISQEDVQGISGTTNPINMAEIGGPTNPITGKIMAPALKGVATVGEKAAGAVAKGAEKLAKTKLAYAGAPAAMAIDAALTGGAHTAAAAGVVGAGAATWAGAKLAQSAFGAAREAGQEMLGQAPAVGQGFFRKTLKEGIKGATGAVPVGGLFALTGDNAESAGDTFWSVVGLGGTSGALAGAKNARAIDARAQFAQTAKAGAAVNYGDAADQMHHQIVSQLPPDAAGIVNYWRGSFDGATTPDGNPIRVQAVDSDTFQRLTGQASRGVYFGGNGTLLINAGDMVNGRFVPKSGPELAQVFAHEGKHAIDEATQASQPALYKAVTDSLRQKFLNPDGKTATPEFLNWIQGQMQAHLDNLSQAGATPDQIDARMKDLGSLDYWISEASADIGQGLITGADLGTFQLSQPMIARVWDAIKDAGARNGINIPSPADSGTGVLDLPIAQAAAREIRRQLYAHGQETAARAAAGPTDLQRVRDLNNILARPRPPAGSPLETTRAWLAEQKAARKELADLQPTPATTFPTSGAPPTAPSKPSAIVSPDSVTQDAIKAKPVETAPVPVPSGTFNDETGTKRTITGTTGQPPRIGDIVATRDGEIRRITRIAGDTVDTARPIDPLNARGTKTHKIADIQPLAHDYATPTEASAGQAASPAPPAPPAFTVQPKGDRFIIVDAAGKPINSTTYSSERDANQGIRQQGKGKFNLAPNPTDAPDIIDTLQDRVPGIYFGGMSKEEAESFIGDKYLRDRLATTNPAYAPDEVLRNVQPTEEEPIDHKVSSITELGQRIEEAYRQRKTLSAQQEAEAKRIAAEKKNAPNEPTTPTAPKELPPQPTRTATIPERPPASEEPAPISEDSIGEIAAQAEAAVTAARAGTKKKAHTLPKEVSDAQVDAVTAAHEQSVPANYQGVKMRTDATGKRTISGTFNPSRPFDAFLLKLADLSQKHVGILQDLQSKIGQTVTVNYGHAPAEDGEVTSGARKAAQAASSAQERAAGEAPQQNEDKNFIPLEVRFNKGKDTPSITVLGASPEKLLNNFNLAGKAVTELGGEVPYRDIHDPHLVADMKQLAQNHANGYRYDGQPIESFPDQPVAQTPGFKPNVIPVERFEFLNLMLGDESAKTGKKGTSPDQQLKQGLAAKNQIPMTEAGETNMLRESINRAKGPVGDTTWSKATIENPLSEALRVDLINEVKTEVSNEDASIREHGYKGDISRFFGEGSPNRTFTAAGFLPDTGAPTAQERARERIAEREKLPDTAKVSPQEAAKQRLAAGGKFMPDDSTKPEEEGAPSSQRPSGQQPDRLSTEGTSTNKPITPDQRKENIMEEAEAAGLTPSLELMKSVIRGDRDAMDKLRRQILERTGRPAKWMPSTSARPNAKEAARARIQSRSPVSFMPNVEDKINAAEKDNGRTGERKVKPQDLGLPYEDWRGLSGETEDVQTTIPVSSLKIGRDELNKSQLLAANRLFQSEDFKSPGEKKFTSAVHVIPSREPGKYVVASNGNHRAAILMLTKPDAKITVTLTRPIP